MGSVDCGNMNPSALSLSGLWQLSAKDGDESELLDESEESENVEDGRAMGSICAVGVHSPPLAA